MKTQMLILLLALSLLAGISYAQPPDTLWTQTFGGDSLDVGYSVRQTSDGGFIITGYTGSFGAGGDDVWLIKTDSLGSQQWAHTYGGIRHDNGCAVLEDTLNAGYVVLGSSSSFSADTTYDAWLIKTDLNGDTLWTRTYGGVEEDFGSDLAQTNDGGFIIIGTTYSYGAGLGDVWLIKTSAQGDSEWTRTFGGINEDGGSEIALTIDGGYIIVGTTRLVSGDNAAWLIKTDSNGDSLWTRTFTDLFGYLGNAVAQIQGGGYIIGATVHESYLPPLSDGIIIRTDSLGHQMWDCLLSGIPYSVDQTSDGGYICAGTEQGGHGRPAWWAFLAKLDPAGNAAWIRNFQWYTSAHQAQQTNDACFIMVGDFESDVWLVCIASDLLSAPQPPVQDNPPSAFQLLLPHPNPFNPTTILSYQLPVASHVNLRVYDTAGRLVTTLVDGWRGAGDHQITFDGSGLPSGIYFAKLKAGDYSQVQKMVLMK